MRRTQVLTALVLAVVLPLIAGCSSSKPTNASPIISKDDAAQIIIADLQYHNTQAKQLTINKITPSTNGSSAIVTFTLTLNDGKQQNGQVTLNLENGQWHLEGHQH